MNKELQVVVGLGITGLSCVRYLIAQGKTVAVMDSRQQPPGLAELQQEFPQVAVTYGRFDESVLAEAETLIVSPGVSLHESAIAAQIAQGTPAIGDIELFARVANAPIVAITGSNGKTTVTTLVGLMVQAAGLAVNVGGNIGQPVLDFLATPAPDFYVLELSSFQLETTFSLQPAAAAVLNISPDHMDRYVSYEDYCQAKRSIYHHCQQAIINFDEPCIWENLSFGSVPVSFSVEKAVSASFGLIDHQGEIFLAHDQRLLLPIKELKLQKRHDIQNALAALALGQAINLPETVMLEVLKQFAGLHHRCEMVAEAKGVFWYNDSKGTNVGATLAAIISFGLQKSGKLILIAGGDAKSADLTALLDPIVQYVDHVILIGRDAPLFAALFDQASDQTVAYTRVPSLEEAVNLAATLTSKGDMVLLSPACASFDMFKNYEHRGEVFTDLVKQLQGK